MIPGRTSYTKIPCADSRSANKAVIIPIPAFDRQYSPRWVLLVVALVEPMLTIIAGAPSERIGRAIICRAINCVRKNGPLRLVASTSS